MAERKPKDLTGLRFGRLTVMGPAYNIGRFQYWECRCSCGCKTYTRKYPLLNGATRSCGCLRAEKARKSIEVAQKARKRQARERMLSMCRARKKSRV